MSSLTQPPLSTLVPQLFAAAEASQTAYRQKMAQYTEEERQARMRNPNGYKEYYGQAKDAYLAVSPETANLLYILTRSIRARSIVEFGTSFGISTLHLAAGLKDNGGGHLIGTEFEPSKAARAREHLVAGGVADLVEIREGDALETLARDLPETIDLVLMDGAKPLYPRVLALLAPRLRTGSLLVADNANSSPEYLAVVRAPGGGYLSVPVDDDVELSMKL